MHPNYDPETLANDITVLELEDLVGGDARPACLPKHPLSFYRSHKGGYVQSVMIIGLPSGSYNINYSHTVKNAFAAREFSPLYKVLFPPI